MNFKRLLFFGLFLNLFSLLFAQDFKAGLGIFDITGDPNNQVMGGYASGKQKTEGIRSRLMARTFVVIDEDGKALAYVAVDEWSVSQAVKLAVADRFKYGIVEDENGVPVELRDSTGGAIFDVNNIMVTASHTHSGLAGYDHHTMYNISAKGHNPRVFEIFVEGIVQSIVRAWNNCEPAEIEWVEGKLTGRYNINRNRSIEAHLNNKSDKTVATTPSEFEKLSDEEKRVIIEDEETVNKSMVMLKFKSKSTGNDIGCFNWFSIHPTSISCTNKMISGDNKGFAELMFENAMGGDHKKSNSFVAGFATGALGDVDAPRLFYHDDLMGYPAEYEWINVNYSAVTQAARAMELFETTGKKVEGTAAFAHSFIRMNKVHLSPEYAWLPEKYISTTAPAANGYASAIGSEVHQTPLKSFYEGQNTENSEKVGWVKGAMGFLKPLRNTDTKYDFARLLGSYTEELQEMHKPKHVLLNIAAASPEWAPQTLPVQLFKIGNIAIIGIPFETTTASGRRITKAVQAELEKQGLGVDRVIYSGNTNAYCGYMTTPEEYEAQHYEGGFTMFGINQTPACMQESVRLCQKMKLSQTGRNADDPAWIVDAPADISDTVIMKRMRDKKAIIPSSKKYGELRNPLPAVVNAGKTMEIEWYASNPNNGIMIQDSFFYIQRYENALNEWVNVVDDNSIETELQWKSVSRVNSATIRWRVPSWAIEGKYRIQIQGKTVKRRKAVAYQFISNEFMLENPISTENQFQGELSLKQPVEINFAEPVVMSAVTVSIDPDAKGVDRATLMINGTSYPLAKIGVTSEALVIRFPENEVNSIKLVISDNGNRETTTVSTVNLKWFKKSY